MTTHRATLDAADWARAIWYGTQYGSRGRTVLLRDPCWIFSCPRCEYRMTAHSSEGIHTVRRVHVRTAHKREAPALDLLDGPQLPRHLKGTTA